MIFRIFSIGLASLEAVFIYVNLGVRSLLGFGVLLIIGLACIWFPQPMGTILGIARYTGVQFFEVPEGLTKFFGWVLLLLPIVCWALFKLKG